jgi:hypothetical protein
MGQRRVFDWSDLLNFLPWRAQLALVAILAMIVLGVVAIVYT